MNNIDFQVAALGDMFGIQGTIFIQIPGKGNRLAKANEVLVEFCRELGNSSDEVKASGMVAPNGTYFIVAQSATDDNYLPCGPGHNYYIEVTHYNPALSPDDPNQGSGAAIRQDFVLNTGLKVTNVKPPFLRHEGNTMPADFS